MKNGSARLKPRRQHRITRVSVPVSLSPELEAAIQAWATAHRCTFDEAAEALALAGLAKAARLRIRLLCVPPRMRA